MASKSPPATGSVPLSEPKRRLLERYLRGEVGQGPGLGEAVPRRPAGANAPLSTGQHQIWLHCQLAPELPLYNEPLTVHRRGSLDVAALEWSLEEILKRHEAWRTTVGLVDGEPVQVVHEPPEVRLPVTDLRSLPEERRDEEALKLATEEARRPFDLARGPLVRFRLIRLGDEEHRLYLTLHQIIFDGVSMYSVFLPELSALYEARVAGRPSLLRRLDIQYGDFAQWQRQRLREDALSSHLDYWRQQLAGAPTVLELPADRPRPPLQSFRGEQPTFALTRSLSDRLKALSQREGATLFMTLLAAFNVLLYRYTGQEDILVGTVATRRDRPELERLLGFFLNTLVLRTRLADDPAFRDLLRSVRDATLEALAHGDVPIEHVISSLQPTRDPGRSPLFQVMFVLEPPLPPPRPGWNLTQMDVDTGIARVDLYLEVDDRSEGIIGRVRYSTDLFDAATIARLLERFKVLLGSIVADPERRISALPVLTPAGRMGSLRRHDAVRPEHAFAAFPREEIEQSLPERFAKQVERDPMGVAVRDESREWSYGALDRAADRVAAALDPIAGETGAQVALLLDHDGTMIAGILGVLKAGAAYVPLDPGHPPERLSLIVGDSLASVVLANARNVSLAKALAGDRKVICIDEVLRGPRAGPRGRAVSPDDAAYILYTSGSTGRPKGVVQNHRNVLHFIAAYTNNLQLSAEDRLTLLSSYSVDASVMDIFGALLNGATLSPIDLRKTGLLGLRQKLQSEGITVYHSTPTVYRHMIQACAGVELASSLRLVVLGGEEVRRDDVEAYKKHLPHHCLLVNGFGPTESTVSLQHFIDKKTKIERSSVPIGHPVESTEVLLLSGRGEPGQLYGEIGIRSRHVSLGYWQRPDLTRRAFLPDPEGGDRRIYRTGDVGRLLPDGSIEFAGRRDSQVKIRGFRIELGEIEAALAQHPGVEEAAAAVRDQPSGERRLVAYWVAKVGPAPSDGALRRFLQEKLPGYMVPSIFVPLAVLPLTPSGKVDRRSLPEPEEVRPQEERPFAPSRDWLELRLARLFEDVLGTGPVGIHDDFFDLGGHSLLAVSLFARIEKAFGKRLPLASLFQAPTVEALARLLREEEPVTHWSSLVAIQPEGSRPPFYVVRAIGGNILSYRDIAPHLPLDQPLYGLQAAGLDGKQTPHNRVEDMAADYIAEMRRLQPEGPYYLGGSSFGGLVAFEMAQQLHAHGQTVGLLGLFDTFGPGYPRWLPTNRGLRRRLSRIGHRIGLHVSNLMVGGPREKMAYILDKANRLRRRFAMYAEAFFDAIRKRLHPLPRELREVEKASRQSLRNYSPKPYLGRITLFRATKQPAGIYPDPTLGWSPLALGGLEIHDVPGHHGAIVYEPRVGVLAQRLRECLERAYAATRGDPNTHGDGIGSRPTRALVTSTKALNSGPQWDADRVAVVGAGEDGGGEEVLGVADLADGPGLAYWK